MKRRTRIQSSESNEYQLDKLEYILGVIHTYAILNTPQSNLTYEYDLVELATTDSLQEYLKNTYYIFAKQPLELVRMSDEEFREWGIK
ncbi:hypothetical protein [Desertivirga arenae]|uniref:hypothetical protein n=1 Tax=Desertivirga arenae TaxID=2810309 RepID=UPI001A97C94F|nr:hypothetical protein [Pedobacter sp. SYSU D00823]